MTKDNDELPSLDSLDARIRHVRQATEDARPTVKVSEGKSFALKSGTELMAGVGVGAFVGYYLDSWLNTRPWLLILFIFFGFAGGVMNMYRAVSKETPLRDELNKLADGNAPDSRKDENAGE